MVGTVSFKVAGGTGEISFIDRVDREYEQPALLAPDAPYAKYDCARRYVRQAGWVRLKSMDDVDMNLLAALDTLRPEGSVTGAARRLGLSSSAMSRTLTRLRSATGDPLLVRAGRRLVPTPRAQAIRDDVHMLAQEVRAILSPRLAPLDLATL